MLQFIRNMVTGWLAVVIVVLLIIPFAFWGINYYFGQGVNVVAAQVNGTTIPLRDYQRSYQQIRQQWQSQGIELEGREQLLKEQAINSLVNQELLNQARNEMGLRVTDQAVMRTIMNINLFQGADGFDTTLYNRYLASIGYTPAGFEAQMRQDLATQQLQSGVIESTFVTDSAIEQIAKLMNQTRDIDHLLLPFEQFAADIEINEEEIESFYEEHSDDFMEPEMVRIAYIDLSLDNIADQIEVSDSELEGYYQANRQDYNVEEQRQIRQIRISLDAEPDAGTLAQATQTAEEILSRLQSGQAFDDVVESVSEAAQLEIEASDFGFLSRGILEPGIEELAFDLEIGAAGGPVQTDSGLHIVQVNDITGGEDSSFAQVRDQVEADYRNTQAERQFYEMSEQLATLAFEHPDTLEIAAEALDVEVRQSDFFSRSGGGDNEVLNDPAVISTAFSDEVMQSRNNSEIIELGAERYLVLRVLEYRPPMQQSLEEVREEIVEAIRFDKGSELTREAGREMVAQLRQGAGQEPLAQEYDLEWQTAVGVTRDDGGVNPFILNMAFTLEKPGNGVTVGGESMASGDFAVVVLNAVHEVGTVSVEDVTPVRPELERIRATGAWNQYLDTLRENAEININQQNL